MKFDRVARTYGALETVTFGTKLQRARVCWIRQIRPPSRVLIVGEGNGLFLAELLRAHPDTEIDCVDASQRMLAMAGRRLCATERKGVRFIHQDVRTWSAKHSYDLVVTHFFLDCFQRDEIELIVAKLSGTAAPDASWLIADFNVPASGVFARMHSKMWLQTMYCFFCAVADISGRQLIDASPYLQANGFVLKSRNQWRFGLVKSDLWRRQPVAAESALPAAGA